MIALLERYQEPKLTTLQESDHEVSWTSCDNDGLTTGPARVTNAKARGQLRSKKAIKQITNLVNFRLSTLASSIYKVGG